MTELTGTQDLTAPEVTAAVDSAPEPGRRRPASRRWSLGRWRIERRPDPRHIGLYRMSSMAIGIMICVAIGPLVATGVSTSLAFHLAWTGTLGSANGLTSILTYAVPLIIGGLAVAVPLRLGRWNVGVDGQIFVGAWAATGVAFLFPHLTGPVLIPLMMIAGMLGGAMWILGPTLARTYLGVSEIVTTFLLNFVGISWLTYWVVERWPYQGVAGGGIRAKPLPAQALLSPINIGGVAVPGGIVLVIAIPIIIWAVMRFTRLGYEVTLSGANERASQAAGIRVRRLQISAMLLGGALGGLAGTVDMIGNVQAYGVGLQNNYGLAAVAIAVLAGRSEVGVLVIGALYSALLAESNAVSIAGVSSDFVLALIGFTLILGAMGEAIARLRIVRTREAAVPTVEGEGVQVA